MDSHELELQSKAVIAAALISSKTIELGGLVWEAANPTTDPTLRRLRQITQKIYDALNQ